MGTIMGFEVRSLMAGVLLAYTLPWVLLAMGMGVARLFRRHVRQTDAQERVTAWMRTKQRTGRDVYVERPERLVDLEVYGWPQ